MTVGSNFFPQIYLSQPRISRCPPCDVDRFICHNHEFPGAHHVILTDLFVTTMNISWCTPCDFDRFKCKIHEFSGVQCPPCDFDRFICHNHEYFPVPTL